MNDRRNLPAQRTLLTNSQRLGFLPTLWFWNDRGRQRLIFPLIAVTGVPLAALSVYINALLHLGGWLPSAFAVLYPFLLMGIVERHIRRELRSRPSEERALAATAIGPSKPLSRAFMATLAVLCLSVSMLMSLGASGSLLLTVALVLMGVAGTLALLPQTRRALHRLTAPDLQRGLPPASGDD
jgi:hypothetical protein